MSSKFSVRPAPRKRPWICKRSPPCYKPPPWPRSLYCTFWFRHRWPDPPVPDLSGTILLVSTHEFGPYSGVWGSGWKTVGISFTYELDPDFGSIRVGINNRPHADEGESIHEAIEPPPLLEFSTTQIQWETDSWLSRVLISS